MSIKYFCKRSNILKLGLGTVGHTGTQAWGEDTSTLMEAILSRQVPSLDQESPSL